MAYRFLQEAAKTRTESVVVEAAVDTTGNVKVELPLELVDLLLRNVYDGEEGETEGQVGILTFKRKSPRQCQAFLRNCLVISWAG